MDAPIIWAYSTAKLWMNTFPAAPFSRFMELATRCRTVAALKVAVPHVMTVNAASAAARLSVWISAAVSDAIFAALASIEAAFRLLMAAAAICAYSIANVWILAAAMAAF